MARIVGGITQALASGAWSPQAVASTFRGYATFEDQVEDSVLTDRAYLENIEEPVTWCIRLREGTVWEAEVLYGLNT